MRTVSGRRESAVSSGERGFVQPVANLHVGVAEQAQPAAGRLHRPQHVGLVEDVGVLVVGGAVADLEQVVDGDGPGRQVGQPVAVLVGERLVGPADRRPGHGVEGVGRLEAGPDLVVVAADHRVRVEAAHPLDDRVRIGAVAHQVAQHQHPVVGDAGGGVEHGLERLDVGMDVAQDEVTHQRSMVRVTPAPGRPIRPPRMLLLPRIARYSRSSRRARRRLSPSVVVRRRWRPGPYPSSQSIR